MMTLADIQASIRARAAAAGLRLTVWDGHMIGWHGHELVIADGPAGRLHLDAFESSRLPFSVGFQVERLDEHAIAGIALADAGVDALIAFVATEGATGWPDHSHLFVATPGWAPERSGEQLALNLEVA